MYNNFHCVSVFAGHYLPVVNTSLENQKYWFSRVVRCIQVQILCKILLFNPSCCNHQARRLYTGVFGFVWFEFFWGYGDAKISVSMDHTRLYLLCYPNVGYSIQNVVVKGGWRK